MFGDLLQPTDTLPTPQYCAVRGVTSAFAVVCKQKHSAGVTGYFDARIFCRGSKIS